MIAIALKSRGFLEYREGFMRIKWNLVKAASLVSLTICASVGAAEAGKVRVCAERQARFLGYQVAGVDDYDRAYFDIRLMRKSGSQESVRDLVMVDESQGGDMYDRLVSMRDSIKACANFYGRLDISDFDGAAIVKDR